MAYRYIINLGWSDTDEWRGDIESSTTYESIDAASIACLDHLQLLPAYQFAFVFDAATAIRQTQGNIPSDPRQPKEPVKDEAFYRIQRFLDRD